MRIIGIDLGSTSIKAVELDSGFGRYEVHEYHEAPLEPGSDPNQLIFRFINDLPKPPDRVVIAMRTSQLTFRNFQLPTRNKKAIQASVGFELEDELPFPLEQAVYDYSVVSQAKQGSTIHVAATLQSHVASTLAFWTKTGIDPDVVTSESWVFRTFLNRTLNPAAQEKPVLIAHLGHERTILYVHSKGTPIITREILWGGRDLTLAICQKYHVPMDHAERAKLDHGFVIETKHRDEATAEQIQFSDTLLQSLQSLISDLKQVKLTCKSIAHQPLSAVYLSGGTSLLPGLAGVLEENLQTPVQPIRTLSSITTSGITYSEHTDATMLVAAAMALSQTGADRSSNINFRKGRFSKEVRTRELNLKNLRKPLFAVAAVALSMFISLTVQSIVYKSKLKDIDSLLEKSVKTFFGQLSGSAVKTYLSNPSVLRTNITKELNKQRELGKFFGPNPHSPLDFLKELSTSIPKSVELDLIQYQVGSSPASTFLNKEEDSATLSFIISNQQVAEKISTILSSKISGIKRDKLEEVASTGDSAKRWKVTFSGRLMEGAYGN